MVSWMQISGPQRMRTCLESCLGARKATARKGAPVQAMALAEETKKHHYLADLAVYEDPIDGCTVHGRCWMLEEILLHKSSGLPVGKSNDRDSHIQDLLPGQTPINPQLSYRTGILQYPAPTTTPPARDVSRGPRHLKSPGY